MFPSPSPTPSTAQSASAGGIASCPATVSNGIGVYSFRCSTTWKFLNCEGATGSFTWMVNPGNCSGEQYHARMLIESETGDHSTDPENGRTISVGQRQSSASVIVSGVSGTRRAYLVMNDQPLGSPKGTAEVLYTFVTSGRTYFAVYDHYPAEDDLTVDFDRMVADTLAFSSTAH